MTVTEAKATITPSVGAAQTLDLGDTFHFATPAGSDGTIDYAVDYTVDGTVQTSYGLAFSITLPYDLANVVIGLGDHRIRAR